MSGHGPSGARRSVIILAGGKSRRMGRDKAALPVDGSTLLHYLVQRLRPTGDELIVAGGADPAIAEVHWVPDQPRGAGPLSGMVAGLRATAAPAAWVLACDLPEVVPALGRLLFDALGGYEAVVPRPTEKAQGLCAVYQTALADRIERFLRRGERSVKGLLDASVVHYLGAATLRSVDPDLRSFRNLNTPEDFARWLSER